VNPPRYRKGEPGNPLPKANASEFYPNHSVSACAERPTSSSPRREPDFLAMEKRWVSVKRGKVGRK